VRQRDHPANFTTLSRDLFPQPYWKFRVASSTQPSANLIRHDTPPRTYRWQVKLSQVQASSPLISTNRRSFPKVTHSEPAKRTCRNHSGRELSDREIARGYKYCAGCRTGLRMASKSMTSISKCVLKLDKATRMKERRHALDEGRERKDDILVVECKRREKERDERHDRGSWLKRNALEQRP
jgi:hypothetical protein